MFQVGLAGIAGVVVSKLATNAGIGFPLAPLIGITVATVFGVIVALPAFRVRGVQLAILTVAGMVAIENFVLDNISWGAGEGTGIAVPAPRLFGLNLGPTGAFPGFGHLVPTPTFGFVCLATFTVFGVFVASLRRSALGQRMLAVRSNERAAAAVGISPRRIKLLAIAISSLIAAVAGVLYAYDFSSVTPNAFDTTVALEIVAFAYLGGITTVRGAMIGGVLTPGALGALAMANWLHLSPDYLLIMGGIGLIVSVTTLPNGAALVPLREQPVVLLARLIVRLVRRHTRGSNYLSKSPVVIEKAAD